MSEADASHDALTRSQGETRASFENRALLYRHLFDVLAEEFGRDRAAVLLKRAIRRRGLEIGAAYRDAVEAGDLAEVARLFCATSPCAGALFEPELVSLEGGTLVLRMSACPLVDAWRASGLPESEVDLMCEVAADVDFGTFEGAGLELTFVERAGQPGCERCTLELTRR